MANKDSVARLKIPEYIKLPDGRKILTKTLLGKQTNRSSYNLELDMEYGYRRHHKIRRD
jgi:hypothetical protein